jgi:hypothetical protein
VEVPFQHMKWPPFDREPERKELALRLSSIGGASFPEAALRRRPTFGCNGSA